MGKMIAAAGVVSFALINASVISVVATAYVVGIAMSEILGAGNFNKEEKK